MSFYLVSTNVIGIFASSIYIIAVMKWKQRIICSLVIFWYVYKLVYFVKFEVITKVNMKIKVFVDVLSCALVRRYHCFTEASWLLIKVPRRPHF